MSFKVSVCGGETLNAITIYSEFISLHVWESGDPSSMAASKRYFSVLESTFKNYFVVEPVDTDC